MKIWIYNDTSCTSLLRRGSPFYESNPPALLVEISRGTAFEYAFGLQSAPGFPGICGLKSPGTTIDDLSVSVGDDFPPIIFSPNPELGAPVLGSALGDLLRLDQSHGNIELFIDLHLVESLLPWLSAASQVGLLLDMSAAPEDELVASIERFIERELIAPGKWAGLVVYDSKDNSFANGDAGMIQRLGLESIQKASAL